MLSFCSKLFSNRNIVFVFVVCILQSNLSFAYDLEMVQQIKGKIKGKVIFLVGYAGSGKGTQGKPLSNLLGIPHVSSGEIFREEVKSQSETGKQMAALMNEGNILPKEIVFPFLREEFRKEKYKNGFILDGFPKNRESYDFILEVLKANQLELLSVIFFNVSRDEAERRLLSRLHCSKCESDYPRSKFSSEKDAICERCHSPLGLRDDDKPETIRKRLDSFEKSTAELLPIYKANHILHTLEATQSPEEMTEKVLRALANDVLPRAPYSLPQIENENTSIFHNHIDGKDHWLVQTMVREINRLIPDAGAQNKIYPVSYLFTGPQTKDSQFGSVYTQLPNFHPIENSREEAFSTGKMGEEINYKQTLATLQVAYSHPHQGVMTEIEEDIYGISLDEEAQEKVTLNRGNTSHQIDWTRLPGWKEKMISNLPKFELHHGFDIVKKPGETTPPIPLSALMEKTTWAGFQNGGWFIFAKDKYWSYRSNEFSNQSYEENIENLIEQARNLHQIVEKLMPKDDGRKFNSSASLEKVHAIWRVQ